MTGSGIFKGKGENGIPETEDVDQTLANKTGLRMYQVFVSVCAVMYLGIEFQ